MSSALIYYPLLNSSKLCYTISIAFPPYCSFNVGVGASGMILSSLIANFQHYRISAVSTPILAVIP